MARAGGLSIDTADCPGAPTPARGTEGADTETTELSKPIEGGDAPVLARHRCRFCDAPLREIVVDLGAQPPCESYLTADRLDAMEPFYPLTTYVCERCFLVQLPQYIDEREIFTEYAYFSSFSETWIEHARRYADAMIERMGLDERSLVVELGSNDGYLLQHFVARGVPVLGVEPAANVAEAARRRGVETLVRFFGSSAATDLAADGRRATLVVGNNVLAQIPDLNDFVRGVAILLADDGLATFEFPHLLKLLEGNQFDTIYHEHFSYFSLGTARQIFAAQGLAVVDVEELPTHGGSLRLFVRHAGHAADAASPSVERVLAEEEAAGLLDLDRYRRFGRQAAETKRRFLTFLIGARDDGLHVAGYGAPGKGNTFLNYCGIRTDLIDYTVDRNPYKHGRFLPGSHIPIYHPERLAETRPNVIVILPWNLQTEIAGQLAYTREWGARLVVAIPHLAVIE